ncbi:MAG: crossover junction endodeoxyribonuclease RuvC [Spirochaetes bacterium]|nr:crossover junction endodeoxyribonuclease RuvC [Spirochaetota bacterium]
MTLGIDPGYGRTGYAFVTPDGQRYALHAHGVIETPAGKTIAERLSMLYTKLDSLIAEHKPDEASIEELFFSKNTKTAIAVAEARGVILLALTQRGVPIFEYTPNEVKVSVAGSGRATKPQIARMLPLLFGGRTITQDDTADAAAAAVTHISRGAVLRAIGRAR